MKLPGHTPALQWGQDGFERSSGGDLCLEHRDLGGFVAVGGQLSARLGESVVLAPEPLGPLDRVTMRLERLLGALALRPRRLRALAGVRERLVGRLAEASKLTLYRR
ncbi:MAG: hypothetical protein AAF602_06690, partial [Myxococcota bacterium]